jgi:hypothetical protein
MRRFDNKKSIKKANLLAEQRYLQSKGLIKEEDVDYTKHGLVKHKKKWYNEFGEPREEIIWLPEPTTLVGPYKDEHTSQLDLKDGDMIVPVTDDVSVKENNSEFDINKFVPGLSDSDWGLFVNMITGHFPGGKDIQGVMLHNQDVIKVIPKLLDPEVMNMVEILKKHPEIVEKLNNI